MRRKNLKRKKAGENATFLKNWSIYEYDKNKELKNK